VEIELEKTFLFPTSITNLGGILDDDFWEISPNGEKYTKLDILEYRSNFLKMNLEIRDFKSRALGTTTILNTYRILHHQETKTSTSQRTSVWENQSGTWRIVLHHSTRV
jgi:hypothetical protein